MINYYIFDPIQFKEFGFEFYKGSDFYYRYQSTKKLFRKTTYIPFGPNCKTKKGFLNFLDHIKGRTIIDLPMIYCDETKKEVINLLNEKGFKKTAYIHQDEETIIINKEDFKIDSKLRNKINRGHNLSNTIIKNSLDEKELKDLYQIYLLSSKRIGFNPKDIDVFKKLSENCLVSLCYKDNKMIGFVFGYIFQSCSKKILMVMFTAQTDEGKANRIGHAMHYDLFKQAFETVDLIDFHGASRTKNRPYVSFKEEFSSNFQELPGSFILS
ncbi:MAG: hypothetical protein PHD93_02095 [Candidatus Pacebacteria bacterium]|nr:hypothetical protein [Candidatus Paceibacterota bacterium]